MYTVRGFKISVFIFLLFLCKLLLGFILFNNFEDSFFAIDSSAYLDASKSLFEYSTFAINGVPEFSRTPGFPLLLYPIYYLNIDKHFYLIIINQIQLIMLSFFIFEISKKYLQLPNNYNYFIVIILITDPLFTLYQFKFLSEISYTVFFIGSLYFFTIWMVNKNNILLVIGFIFLAAATYIRPGTIYLLFILYLFILIYILDSSENFKLITIGYLSLGFFISILIIFIWIYRNYSLAGLLHFSTIQAINLYQVNTAGIISHAQNIDYVLLQGIMSQELNSLPINARSQYANNEFLKAVISYPISTLVVFAKGFIMILIEPGVQEWLNFLNLRNSSSGILNSFYSMSMLDFLKITLPVEIPFYIVSFIFLISSLLFLICSIFGFIKAVQKNRFSFIFLIYIGYITFISSGPYSYSRFRIPVVPLLIVLTIYYFYAKSKKCSLEY